MIYKSINLIWQSIELNMFKWKLLLILLTGLQISLIKGSHHNVELGIGNFPIPDLQKQFPGVQPITLYEHEKSLQKSWELWFDLSITRSASGPVLIIKASNPLEPDIILDIFKINEVKKTRYFRLLRDQLETKVIEIKFKVFSKPIRVKVVKNDNIELTVYTFDGLSQRTILKSLPQSELEKIEFNNGKTDIKISNVLFLSGSIENLVNETVEEKSGQNESEVDDDEEEDTKKNSLLHGVNQINTSGKNVDGVLEKAWQLYFDIIIQKDYVGKILKIKSQTNPEVIDVELGIQSRSDLENMVSKNFRFYQYQEYKNSRTYNQLASVEINPRLLGKKMKVKIIKNDGLQLTVNGRYNSVAISNEILPEYALRSALIDFTAEPQILSTLSNVLFINGLSEIKSLTPGKLFKTFRILVDLRLKDREESTEPRLLFNIKNENKTLIEVSYTQQRIGYCYYLAKEHEKCKYLTVAKNEWVHLLIDQWKHSDSYYSSIQINSVTFTKKTVINKDFEIVNPNMYDVVVAYNVLNVDIKNFIIFNPASNAFGVVRYKKKQIYSEGWSSENSHVVCKMFGFKYAKEMSIENNLQIYNGFKYSNKKFNCKDEDKSFDKCLHEKITENKFKEVPAAVACSNWSDDLLYKSLDNILLTGTNINIISSLKYYMIEIRKRFGEWSCISVNPDNQNICSVVDVISEALLDLKNHEDEISNKNIKLSDQHNLQKLLEFEFLKKNFDYLKNEIFKTRETIGKYFRNVADFDNQLANHDLTYALDMWDKANDIIKEKEDNLVNSILELHNYAIATKTADFFHNTAKLTIQVLGRINPIKWLTDSDGGIIDPLETAIEMERDVKDFAIIALVYSENIVRLNEVLTSSNTKRLGNKENFKTITEILNKAKSNKKLTLEDSKKFLELYGGYTPAIEQSDIDKYSSIVETMVDTFVDKLTDSKSIIGVATSGFGEYHANNVKMALKLLFGQYEVVKEKQAEIMDAFARSARSMIAKQSAEDIINDSGITNLQKRLQMIKGVYLTRLQRLKLYTDLCNVYTYRNHGKQTSDCTQILADPDTNDFRLLSYNSKHDMCNNAETVSKVVLIPLSLTGGFNHGILSSDELFNYHPSADPNKDWVISGTTYFKIPNTRWLVNHGWISSEIKDPIFLKKLDLYLPPESKDVSFSYEVEIQSDTVTLKDTKYFFESKIRNKISYRVEDCLKPENNPYKMKDCRKSLTNPCVLTSGQIDSSFLPVLTNSKFQISLRSRAMLTKLYPTTVMYLKANVEICWKNNEKPGLKRQEVNKPVRSRQKMDSCCTNTNHFFDLFESINSHRRKKNIEFCKPCPTGSKPKLFGYFCQQCPVDFEETSEWFGCLKKAQSVETPKNHIRKKQHHKSSAAKSKTESKNQEQQKKYK